MSTFSSVVLLSFLISVLPGAAFAQAKPSGDDVVVPTATNLSSFNLNSSWLISITGGNRVLTLHLSGGTKQGDAGKLVLAATLGLPGLQPLPVTAELTETARGRDLFVATRLGGKIVATQNQDGTFTGTITDANGQERAIGIRQYTEKELADNQLRPDRNPAMAQGRQEEVFAIKTPAVDVPAACAAFIGGWKGVFMDPVSRVNFDPHWLWVTEINEKCIARYSYEYSPEKPKAFKSEEIKNGELTVLCGGGRGYCTFTSHGDALWVSYRGNSGAGNNAVFRKVSPE
jgi:hypothetical protein